MSSTRLPSSSDAPAGTSSGWLLVTLFVLFGLDVALPSTLGAVCPSKDHNCAFGAVAYMRHVWLHTAYHYGESSLDLLVAALVRAALFLALLALRLCCSNAVAIRARVSDSLPQPMLQPLNASMASSLVEARAAASEGGVISRTLASHLALALTALSWAHVSSKGVARLLQSGHEGRGDGFAVLPLETSPPEVEFWLCMVGAFLLSELERRAFERLSSRRPSGSAGADSTSADRLWGSGSSSAPSKSAAEAAADAASEIKKAYVKRTEPRELPTVRVILGLMAPDAHLLLLAYSSLLIAAAGETIVPYLYGQVIDAIAIQPSPENLRKYIMLLILTALVTGIFTGLRGSTFIVLGGRFGKRLRLRLFESLLAQELDFFGAVKTGDVTSRLSADCQKVADQVQLNVNVFLRSVVQVVFTLVLMFYINFKLALASFIIVPAIVTISKVFSDYMRALSTETQDTLADANSTAEEVISSISTTRAFSAEREEIQRYADGMGKYVGTVVRQARLYFFYSSLTFTFLPYLTYCLILFFAAQLIHTPDGCLNPSTTCSIDGPHLISFVFYMQSLFAAFQSLGSIYTALAQAIGAADKVIKWIHRKPTIEPAAKPIVPHTCAGELRLDEIHFAYQLRPDRPVLSGLSLHAAAGEVVALCGPSGGGKSSIISLIERFYVPDSGQVLLDGVDIAQLSPPWYHRKVALVGQEPTLFARSLYENICYGLEGEYKPHVDEVVRAASLANAHDFISIQEHGYETIIGERGTQLSGGQKQRVAIARALVRKPAVLLLDEATSALDAESEHVVQEAIDCMIAQGSMTVLVIAHRLSTIRNADKICVIKDGRVAEMGKHAELLAQPDGEYARLVHRQMDPNGSQSTSRSASRPPSQLPSSANLAGMQAPASSSPVRTG